MLSMRRFFFIMLFALFSLIASAAGPVDINTATADELAAAIKGIGPKKAAAIVAYREQYGAFKSVDELKKVPGIGDKILQDNSANLMVGDSKPMSESPSSVPKAPSMSSDMKSMVPSDKLPTTPKQ